MNRHVAYLPRSDTGISLLEALISLLIISISVLGILLLQARVMKINNESIHHQQASILASNLIEKMRINKAAVINTDGNIYDTYFANSNDEFSALDKCVDGETCTNEKIAAQDIQDWRNDVANVLPSGKAILCQDVTPNDGTSLVSASCSSSSVDDLYVVKIFWKEKDQGDQSNTDERYILVVENIESL